MDTATTLRERIKDFSMKEMEALSAESGVPFRTLYKISRGHTKNPQCDTADALFAALNSRKYRRRAALQQVGESPKSTGGIPK